MGRVVAGRTRNTAARMTAGAAQEVVRNRCSIAARRRDWPVREQVFRSDHGHVENVTACDQVLAVQIERCDHVAAQRVPANVGCVAGIDTQDEIGPLLLSAVPVAIGKLEGELLNAKGKSV